jgi:hypothetical protein
LIDTCLDSLDRHSLDRHVSMQIDPYLVVPVSNCSTFDHV